MPFERGWHRRDARVPITIRPPGMCLAGGTRALLLLALVLCQRAGLVDGKNDNCEYAPRASYRCNLTGTGARNTSAGVRERRARLPRVCAKLASREIFVRVNVSRSDSRVRITVDSIRLAGRLASCKSLQADASCRRRRARTCDRAISSRRSGARTTKLPARSGLLDVHASIPSLICRRSRQDTHSRIHTHMPGCPYATSAVGHGQRDAD